MAVKLKWMAVRTAEPFTPKMRRLRYFGHAVAPLCVVAESIWNGAVPKWKGEGRHSLSSPMSETNRAISAEAMQSERIRCQAPCTGFPNGTQWTTTSKTSIIAFQSEVDHPALTCFEGWSDLSGRRFQLCKRDRCPIAELKQAKAFLLR